MSEEKRFRYRCIEHSCPHGCYISCKKDGFPIRCPFFDIIPEFTRVSSNEFGEMDNRTQYPQK